MHRGKINQVISNLKDFAWSNPQYKEFIKENIKLLEGERKVARLCGSYIKLEGCLATELDYLRKRCFSVDSSGLIYYNSDSGLAFMLISELSSLGYEFKL